MEGDGEGMMAIVQGLDSAGVTLTVMNRSRQNTDRRRSPKPRIQFSENSNFPRSSVETSTDATRKSDTGVQICDGRYASSYKTAHCMVSPTSPPEGVSEFPPQRKEPCRNQGNFEVGGHGSGYVNQRTNSRFRVHTGCQVRADRSSGGLLHRSRSSRYTEAFVHSLRKYPSVTGRTVSTDLIERLLRYTQSKNSSRGTRPSRSMRSLNEDGSSDFHDSFRASKHQQTYTRKPKDAPSGPIGYKGRARNFRLYSPVSESRHLRESLYRDPKFSTSYDYLRAGSTRNRSDGSPSPSGSRSPSQPARPLRFERPAHSVRDMSLSDVSKYIRSTIRQIYRERPFVFQVCPRLMNRYYQHKKICPVQNDGAVEPTINDQESAGPRTVSSRFLPTKSSCSEPKIGQSVGFQCNGTYCSCSRSIQCSCYPDVATNTSLTNLQPKKSKHVCCPKVISKTSGAKCVCPEEVYKTPMTCSCANDDEFYYNHRIDEEISDWLKHVPVQSIESAEIKRKRDSMVRQLRKTMKQVKDDENSDDNITMAVKSFMEDFPIWSPGKDKKDEMQFKDKLAESLIGRIIGVPRKPDKFRDFVKKWARENVDFEDGLDDADKEADIDNIVNQLKRLAADRPDNDVKYKEMLIEEITKIIKQLPLKIQDNRDATINKWASKLASYIVTIPKNIDLSEDRTDFTFDLEDSLEGLLKELGIIREALQQLKDDPNTLPSLAKRLNKLQAQGIDDDTVREKMKNELHKFMDDLGIAQEMIDELVGELMNEVDDTVRSSHLAIHNVDELHEIVVNWLESIPGIDKIDKAKFDKVSRDLVNGIKEAREEGSEDMESEIFGRIDEADLPIDAETIRKHIPDLIKKLDMWPSNKLYNDQAKQILLDEIHQIIDATKVSEEKKQSIKLRVKKIIDSHIMNASALDARQVQDYLKDALSGDVGKAISEEGIAAESHLDLLNKLRSAVSRNYFKSFIGLGRYSSDLKQSATKFIRGALDDVPMNARKKKELIDEVKNTLDRNINKHLPEDIEDTIAEEICGIVEESPVCEDENIAKYLKCLLSSISTKVFDMFVCKNNCVCHIQNRVENDVCELIDSCPMDCNKKRDLKRNVQDILSENEFRELSDDAKHAVKGDIISVVSDLSIPEDKKNYLRSSVSETISQDFGDAIFGLKHDIGKVKQKIFNHLNSAIERAPMSLDAKEYFYSKLKRMLNEKLDSTLTNEEKNTILDDVSDIVEDVIPEDKKIKLRNKLTNKLESEDNDNAFTTEMKMSLDQSIKDIIEKASIPQDAKNDLQKQLTASLDNNEGESMSEVRVEIKGKMFDIIDESPIVEEKQRELKKELVNLLTSKMGGTSIEHIGMDDYKRKVTNDISELLTKLPISEDEKTDIRYQIGKKVSEAIYKPLTDDVKTKIKKDVSNIVKETDIPDKELPYFKSKLDTVLKRFLNVTPEEDKDTDVIKEDIKQNLNQTVEELPITNDKKRSLKIKFKDLLVHNIDCKMTDKIQEDINKEIGNIIDDSVIPEKVPESKVLDMKDEVADIVAGLHLDEYMREYVVKDWIKELLTKNVEDIVNSFPTDSKNKAKVNKDIEKVLVHSLYIPMTDTIKTNIRRDIINVVDKMGIDDEESSEVKRRLSSALAKGMDKKMAVGKDLDQIKSALQQIIKEGVVNAPIPEYTQDLLGQETEDILNENLIQPITDEMKSNIHDQIDIILEDAKVESEKYMKKLISTIERNLRDIRSKIKGDLEAKKAKEIMLERVRQKIDESSVDKQKKLELKSNLDKTTADYLSMPFTGKVRDDFEEDIEKIVKDLTVAGVGEKRSKRISISVDEGAEGEIQDRKLKLYIQDLENETQKSILTKLKKAIDAAPIYADKKREAKKNLLNTAKDYFDKPLTEDSLRDLKDDLIDILDELQLPKDTRDKMLQQLSNSVDELMKSLKRRSLDPQENIKVNVLHAIKNTVNYATIPKDKKLELKNQLTEMAVRVFNTTPMEYILDALQDGASDILDDYPLIRDKKIKLRRDLEDSIEEYLGSCEYYYPNVPTRFICGGIIPDFHVQKEERKLLLMEEINRNKLKKSILQSIEEVIEKCRLPKKKKENLKEKLSKTIDKTVRTSVPKDLEADLKDGIYDVLDETLIFESDKYKVKDDLTNVVDQKMEDIRRFRADESDTEGQRLQNFFYNLEKALDDALIPISKKNTLKNKLKILSDTGFKPPFSEGAQNIIIEGVDEILDELLSKDARKKNRKELRDILATGKNKQNVQEQIKLKKMKALPTKPSGATQPDEDIKESEPKTLHDFFKIIENEINESHIFRKKKVELGINLHKIANDLLDNSWSEDVKDELKRGISNILDDLLISRARKHRLKSNFETLIDEPSEASSSLETWTDVKELQKYPLEIFFHKLEEIIDENPVPVRKNKILKKKLKDLSSPGFKQPFTRKQRTAVYDILDALPLSRQEKSQFLKELADIFGVVWTKGKESDRSKPPSSYAEKRFENTDDRFEDFFNKFEEVIDENPHPEYKKKVLKRKLKELCTSGFRQQFSRLWRNGVYNILNVLTLSEEEKSGILKELGDILCIDLNTDNESEMATSLQTHDAKPDKKESSKLFLLDERVITKARESIVKNIERRIKETFMPGSKKAILIGRLHKLASNELQKPLSENGQEYVRQDIADIINKLPIDEAEKDELMQMVEENIEILKDLNTDEDYSHKQIQESISSALDHIVNKTLIVEEKKMYLKKKLRKLVHKTFEEVSPDNVHGALIDGVNDIVNEAELAKAKRDKLKGILMEAIDDNIGDLRDDEIDITEDSRESNIYSVPMRQMNDTKTRTIEISTDLAPFDEYDNFGTKTNKERRYRSKDSMPLQMKLLEVVDDSIADMRGETIGIETNPIIYRKGTVEKYTHPTEEAQKFKKRGGVLKNCAEKFEKWPLLHMELNSETLDEGNTDDDTADLVEDIPLDKTKKHESAKVGNESLVRLHGKQPNREQTQIQSILNALATPIDDSLITKRQKDNLKEKLKIMFTKNYRKPLTDDLRDALKAEINVVLNEMPLTNNRKNKLEYELFHSLDSHLNHQRDMRYPGHWITHQRESNEFKLMNTDNEPKSIEGLFKIIENQIDESPINRRKKSELKNNLQKIAEGYLKNSSFGRRKEDVKSGISNILNNLPTSEADTDILKKYMKKSFDNRPETFSCQGTCKEEKDLKQHQLETFFRKLEQTIEGKQVPATKSNFLKKKLNDVSFLGFEQLLTGQQRNIVYDILDILPISEEEKNRFLKEFADILHVDWNIGKESERAKSILYTAKQGLRDPRASTSFEKDILKAKERVVGDIERKIKETPMAISKKIKLMEKLEKITADNLQGLLSEGMRDYVIKNIGDIIQQLPIEEAEKYELTHKVEINIKIICDESQIKELRGKENPEERWKSQNSQSKNLHEYKSRYKNYDAESIAINEIDAFNARFQKLSRDSVPVVKKFVNKQENTKAFAEKYGDYRTNSTPSTSSKPNDMFKSRESIVQIIEHKRSRGKRSRDVVEDNNDNDEDYQAKDKRSSTRTLYTDEPENSKTRRRSSTRDHDTRKHARENIVHEFENKIKEASISRRKRTELLEKLEKVSDSLKIPFSESHKNRIINDLNDIMEQLPIQETERNELTQTINDNIECLIDPSLKKKELQLLEKTKEDNIHGFEEVTDKALISSKIKTELKKTLKDLINTTFHKPSDSVSSENLKYGIFEVLDTLITSKNKKNILRGELFKVVDENIEKYESELQQLQTGRRSAGQIKESIKKSVEHSAIGDDIKCKIQREISEMLNSELWLRGDSDEDEEDEKSVNGLIASFNLDPQYETELNKAEDELRRVILEGGDVDAAKERLIKKIMDDTGLSREQATELVDKLHEKANKGNKDNFQTIIDTFNLDPEYEKELKGIEDELTKVILEGGDLNAAKERLIKKIMDETGLSREQATLLVNNLEAKAKKENQDFKNLTNTYNLNPEYATELKKAEDELLKVILEGGDLDAEKERLIKKIMAETGLPREQATELVDELLAKANKDTKGKFETLTKTFNLDPKYEKELKGIEDELAKVILEGGDVDAAKERLIKKIMDETGLPRDQAAALVHKLHAKVNADNKDNFPPLTKTFNLDPKYESELKGIEDDLKKVILEGGDVDAAKERLIKKIMDETGLPRDQAAALVDRLHAKASDDVEDIKNLTKTFNLDPKHEAALKEVEDELTKVILEGGDVDAAKDRLIKKIMDETGLPRDEAAALVDKLHAKANKDNKERLNGLVQAFNLDPQYKKELLDVEDELAKVILEGGDVNAAKEKLIKKIMDETGLPREQATELVNRLHAKVNAENKERLDGPLQALNLDSKYKKELKDVEDELTKIILEGGDVGAAKERLIKKIMDETGLSREQAAELVDKLHAKANIANQEKADKKRRRNSPCRPKRRIPTGLPIEKIKEPLREEISDILVKHQVRPGNANKLIEDIFYRLEDLAANGGDPFVATTSCSKSLLLRSYVSRPQARKISNKLVNKAREISLILKAKDSKEKIKSNSFDSPKHKFTNVTQEIYIAPEAIKINKNKRPASTDTNFISKADEMDNISVKMDVINIPKDKTLSVLKNQIKNALYRNIKQILNEAALPSCLGYELRDNLNNAVEKDLDKSVLKEKKDISNLKQVILQDIYEVIDDAPINTNDSEMFKSKLTEAVDKNVNEVILTDTSIQKERLSRNLDDVISQLPVSGTEKHDLKNTSTTIYSESKHKLKKNQVTPRQKRSTKSRKKFAPKAKSTFKNGDHLEIIEETQATSDTAQKTTENLEKDYTEEVIEIVKAWLEKIPLDIEVSTKETFINELMDDIMDRKNYVTHAPVKPSFAEDLEYLKVQVLKRTTDFLTPDSQKLVLGSCKALLNKINEMHVPGVTGPRGAVPQGQLQSAMEDGGAGLPSTKALKAFQDSLIREMDSFLGPLDMPNETKDKLKRTLLNELDRLLKNKTDPDIIMQNLIAITKRLTNLSDNEAIELARRLMNKTKEKGFLPRVCCTPERLSFGRDAVCVQRKAFRDAILREVGDGFFGCQLSEEKKKYLEDLLIEDYAKEYGITLTECCPTDDIRDENDITTIVNDWISTIPVTMSSDQDYKRFVHQKNELIPKIKEALPASDYGRIREDAKAFLLKIPLHPDYKENEEQQDKKVEDLIDKFLCLPPKAKGHRYGMSFSGLTEYIDSWIDNLHISDDTRDEEAIKDMKKGMTYSLVHKLGEMNIDPEIFNDDSLYEEVLKDELQNMLGDVTITDANIKALKDDLIDKVKSAQQRAHDEIIGQNYKHKLRHAMTNILPPECAMSREEHAAMELLKDQLADAFIDLNYSGDDENLRARLKRKITSEIHMFCNDYLSSHPASPLSNKQLNLELFNALTSVPLPSGDSIRYEVEQARIREVINEWIKELPLQYQNPSELLTRNRLIYVLSKKLFDIETAVEDSPDEPMRKEIMKFLHKMPFKSENDNNHFANNLIEKLNSSKESRRFDDGSDEIDAYGNICDSSCPRGGAASNYRRTAMTQERICSRRPSYPPCTLSAEDKTHLDRIRRRSCVTPNCVKALLKNYKCSAAVGPQPMDAQSQTELRPQGFDKDKQSSICTGTNEKMTRPCPGMSSSPRRSPCGFRRHTVSSTRLQRDAQEEVLPQITVKKYYWDSNEKSNFQDSGSQQARAPYSSSFSPSRPGTCHPSDFPCQRPASYQRPSTPPYHRKQTETVPCQAGTPPYKKSSQSPYHRDCYKHDYQQQSTSPHRVPCNYDHSITQGPDTKPTVGRFYHWSPQRSFQERISQSSQRSTPRSRSPQQSPCMSRSQSPYGMNHESTPLSCSNRVKRNGLQEQIPCTNSRPSRKERVTELGSLDDIQHPRAKKNNSSFDWSYGQHPEDDSFWGTPCMRRVILDEGIDEPLMMEREEREERVTCKCKQRVYPKAMRTGCMHSSRDQDGRNGNRCSKCCGVHCPYPSFLYFRE